MIQLKCKRFLLVLMLCSFSFTTFAQANDSLLSQLARKWVNSKAYTLRMAELMPEEFYNFKPVADEMSFKQQLIHIAQNINWLSSSYLFSGKAIAFDTTNVNKPNIIKLLTYAYDKAAEAHHHLTAMQLDEVVSFFAGPMTRRQILILLHDHQTHHVGQLIVYLRLKNIKPPDYIGW